MLSKVTLLLVLFLLESIVDGQQSIQCGPSSSQSGQAILPNIPDFYFQPNGLSATDDRYLRISVPGFTYIFTVPPTNCSGDVVAMQYCYDENSQSVDRGQSKDLFNFLVLEPEGGSQYRVVQSFLVQSSPVNRECGNHQSGFDMCCDTLTLSPRQRFNISTSSDFTYGITVHALSDLIEFDDFIMDVPQIEARLATGTRLLEPGATSSISRQPSLGPLPLMRLQVETDGSIAPSREPSTIPTMNAVQPNMETATDILSTNIDTTSTDQTTTDNNVLIIATAASVASVIVALSLMASIVLAISVCAARGRSHRKSSCSDKPLPPRPPQRQCTHVQTTELTLNQAYNIPMSTSSKKPLPLHVQTTELTLNQAYNVPMDITMETNNIAPHSEHIYASTTDYSNLEKSVTYDYIIP